MLDLTKQLKELKKLKNNLEKKDEILIVSDLDDTIFCRKEQLEDNELLRNNRWADWIRVILEQIWIENFIEKYYKWKSFPKTITDKMISWKDLILTAWEINLQTSKIKALNLENINHSIVWDWEKKPFELVRYVVEDLAYIPSKIIIYEDRPEYFIENKRLIEDFLWTTLEIILVEMIDNNSEAQIKRVA